jgi:hypothetical protein
VDRCRDTDVDWHRSINRGLVSSEAARHVEELKAYATLRSTERVRGALSL